MTGVYWIFNLKNGKAYVGSSTTSIVTRFKAHRDSLRANTHYNRYLQAAWNKYGERAFVFEELELCQPDLCIEREQHYIDTLQTCDRSQGYNLSPTAGNCRGTVHGEEARRRMSEAHKGRKQPAEEVERRRLAVIKAWQDEERRRLHGEKMRKVFAENPHIRLVKSQKMKGRTISDEQRAKMSKAQQGRKLPPEVRKKISEVQKGKKASEETRRKMSAARKGRKLSPETIERMKATKRRKCRTPEFRAKMSEVVRKQWEKRKGRVQTDNSSTG